MTASATAAAAPNSSAAPTTGRRRSRPGFEVYRDQTAPILPYYGDRGILRRVDGMADIEAVTREIDQILGWQRRTWLATAATGLTAYRAAL